ncbi:uncharacterized [Tachysurus ichikawai]
MDIIDATKKDSSLLWNCGAVLWSVTVANAGCEVDEELWRMSRLGERNPLPESFSYFPVLEGGEKSIIVILYQDSCQSDSLVFLFLGFLFSYLQNKCCAFSLTGGSIDSPGGSIDSPVH